MRVSLNLGIGKIWRADELICRSIGTSRSPLPRPHTNRPDTGRTTFIFSYAK